MDDFDEKIRQIKVYRSADCFLDDIFENLTTFKFQEDSTHIFFIKDNEALFEYIPRYNDIWFHNDKICLVLMNKYHVGLYDVYKLLESKFKKYFNINNFVLKTSPFSNINSVKIPDKKDMYYYGRL